MDIGIDFDETLITTHRDMWDLIEGAVDNLLDLYRKGYNLHIITARYDNMHNRRQIEEACSILRSRGISIKDITFTSGSPKGSFARRLGCKYMIDDNTDYLSDCLDNGVVPIHFMGRESRSLPGCVVVGSWDQTYDILP